MTADIWLGAATTLLGAALGGAISFGLNRQQMKNERLRRMADRQFEAFSDFLKRARSFQNALHPLQLGSAHKPALSELDSLIHLARDASAPVFLLLQTERTYNACVAVLQVLDRTQGIIHGIESNSGGGPWREIIRETGRVLREFQNTARAELDVNGPEHTWVQRSGGSAG